MDNDGIPHPTFSLHMYVPIILHANAFPFPKLLLHRNGPSVLSERVCWLLALHASRVHFRQGALRGGWLAFFATAQMIY